MAVPPAGAFLELRVGLARGVEEKVGLEAHGLLDEEGGDGDERGVFGQLREGDDASLVFPLVEGGWHVRHVLVQVAVVLVVLSVGEFPAEVRVEAVGVEEPANKVVGPAVAGEGLVTALVGEDPQPRHGQRQQVDVDGPSDSSERRRRQQRDARVGDCRKEQHAEHVPEQEAPRHGEARAEALFRNRLEHVVDGEVGGGKALACRVHSYDVSRRVGGGHAA